MYLLYSFDILILIVLYYLFVTRRERNHSTWTEAKRIFSSRESFVCIFKRTRVLFTILIISKVLFVPFVYIPYAISDFRIKHFETRYLTTEERKIFQFFNLALTYTPLHSPIFYGLIQYRKKFTPYFTQYAYLLDSRRACHKSDFKDFDNCSEYMQNLIFRENEEVKELYYQEFLSNADNLWEKTLLANHKLMPEMVCNSASSFLFNFEELEDVIDKVKMGCYELKCKYFCWRLENYLELPEISEEYKKY